MSALHFNYQLAFRLHFADITWFSSGLYIAPNLSNEGKKLGTGLPLRKGSSCYILSICLAWCVPLQPIHFYATFSWLTSASACQKGNGNYRQAIDSHGVASYQCYKYFQKLKKTPSKQTTKPPKMTPRFTSFPSRETKSWIMPGLACEDTLSSAKAVCTDLSNFNEQFHSA